MKQRDYVISLALQKDHSESRMEDEMEEVSLEVGRQYK